MIIGKIEPILYNVLSNIIYGDNTTPIVTNCILLEDGSYLLLEDGSKILLEQ